jgi:hypothetical protein
MLAPSRWSSHLISLASGPALSRRLCGGIVHPRSINLSLWTSLAITIWWSYGLRCSLPPPLSWPPLPTPPSFHPGLYRRICASIIHTSGVNLSLWTSLAVRIWSSYGLTCGCSGSAKVGEEVGEFAEQQSTRCRGR